MAKSKIDFAKAVKRDLEKFASNYGRIAAGRTRDELAETAVSAISQFYKDYQPMQYKRHFDNLKKRSFKKWYKNNVYTYEGGIIIDYSMMADVYTWSPVRIGEMVYEQGLHGHFSLEEKLGALYAKMSPTPIEIINNKYEEISDDYESGGLRFEEVKALAFADSYEVIS